MDDVHLIIDVKPDERGRRTIGTRCGQKITQPLQAPLADAGVTAWASMVTCPGCH